MPKAGMTGKEKKTKKALLKVQREIAHGKHAPTLSLQDLMNDFKRAGQGAEEFYAPIKEEALHQFGTETIPGVYGQFGSEMGSRSSALTQALSAARENLSRSLASDFAGFKTNLAQNLVGQRESNKMNYLNTLAGLSTSPLAYQPSYLSKGASDNRWKGALGGAIQGGIQGGMAGGPWGAAAGAVLGGTGGYFSSGVSDYGPSAQASGDYVRQLLNKPQTTTSPMGGFNQL